MGLFRVDFELKFELGLLLEGKRELLIVTGGAGDEDVLQIEDSGDGL